MRAIDRVWCVVVVFKDGSGVTIHGHRCGTLGAAQAVRDEYRRQGHQARCVRVARLLRFLKMERPER